METGDPNGAVCNDVQAALPYTNRPNRDHSAPSHPADIRSTLCGVRQSDADSDSGATKGRDSTGAVPALLRVKRGKIVVKWWRYWQRPDSYLSQSAN